MARLEFFVVSNSVSIDRQTNLATIIEVAEVFTFPDFPGMVINCVAFSLWRREEGEEGKDFQVALRIASPDADDFEMRSNFKMTRLRHRMVQRVQGIPILREGQVRFEVLLNGEHAAEHIVDVKKQGGDSETAHAE